MGDRTRRQPYPWAGLVLLAFGGLTELAAIALCVYGVLVLNAGLGVLGGTLAVWIGGLWLVVLGGVRDDWPP